jgi:hypothetical protein
MLKTVQSFEPSPVKRRGGRPTKFTPELTRRILKCLGRGMPLTLAVEAAGIEFTTLQVYRRKYPNFAQRVKEAIAKGVERRLKKIEAASNAGDWRAAAWLLEHCQPEHFGRNRVEVTGADGSPLAAAIAIYLPQKDSNRPTVEVSPPKPLKSNESH